MKRFLIILVLFFVSFSAWSFEYLGVGLGPNVAVSGGRPTNFLIQGEWQPHKVVGTKLIMGVGDSFWLGVALNFKQHLADLGRGTIWESNISIPFIFSIKSNSRVVFVGLTLGTSLSFDIDGKNANYFFITPIELLFTPWGWALYPSSLGGWRKDGSVSLMCSAGFRFAI